MVRYMFKLWHGWKVLMKHVWKQATVYNLQLINVFCLFLNALLLAVQMLQTQPPVEAYFQTAMDDNDKAHMLHILKTFVSTMDKHNLTYFMDAGTLIGSYRHHGFIPWDDDVDLLVNASQKEDIRDVLRSLQPEYELYTANYKLGGKRQWKFYSNSRSRFIVLSPFMFKWPYIDIFFFQENSTHIWLEVPRVGNEVFPKTEVFPLVRRPFEDLFLNAPYKTEETLKRMKFGDLDICRSRSFSHSVELPVFELAKDVPCSHLRNHFPFVHRKYTGNTVNETLLIGEWALQSHIFNL